MSSQEATLVRDTLIAKGLETPLAPSLLSPEQKYERIKGLLTDVVETLGLDLNDDSLKETPHRIAKMYVNEIFSGLNYDNFPKISVIDNKMSVDEMVKVSNISLISTCEHHFITIDGLAKVAYIPEQKNYWFVQNQSHRKILRATSTSARTLNATNISRPSSTARYRKRRGVYRCNALLRQI